MRTAAIICLLGMLLSALPSQAAKPSLALPLTVWDVTFNEQPLNRTPQGLNKEQRTHFETVDDLGWAPLRTYTQIAYLTLTRKAEVVQSAAGLNDRPLRFTFTENAQPQYGPQAWLQVPHWLAEQGTRWRLSFDVAKGNVTISGGVLLWDIAGLEFHEDGTFRANGVTLCRYAAGKPLHVVALIDVPAKTITLTVDGRPQAALTLTWREPRASAFQGLRLDGLLPGGHSEAPAMIAFDNLRLVLLATARP